MNLRKAGKRRKEDFGFILKNKMAQKKVTISLKKGKGKGK